jgi:hypothetical protein
VSVSQSALLTKQLLCGYNLSLRGKSVLELGRRRKEGRKEEGGRRKEEGGRRKDKWDDEKRMERGDQV